MKSSFNVTDAITAFWSQKFWVITATQITKSCDVLSAQASFTSQESSVLGCLSVVIMPIDGV